MDEKVELTDEEWRERLTPEQYEVLRRQGTERAFSGAYADAKQAGMYKCAGCGAELFSSDTKFESGTGWPSFWEPAESEAVELRSDGSHGMVAHRGRVPPLRRPSRPRLPRRPQAHRSALLHQLPVARARPRGLRRLGLERVSDPGLEGEDAGFVAGAEDAVDVGTALEVALDGLADDAVLGEHGNADAFDFRVRGGRGV